VNGSLTYGGDETLAGLLRAAGSPLTVAEVRLLLAGLLAAPATGTAVEEPLWLSLVAPDPPEALQAQLGALRASLAGAATQIDDQASRPQRLRAELGRRGLDGFIVAHGDEYRSEYLPKCGARLAWLTGFTGSAGLAILLADKASIFIDGRYTLQVKNQVDLAVFQTRHLVDEPPADWLAAELPPGCRVGYDPKLHGIDEVARFRAAVEKAGGSLVAVADNPLDAIWQDRPPAPLAPVVAHDLAFTGESAADKRRRMADSLVAAGADAAVIAAPDSIAWLLNIRGGDVPHTPLALAFAILFADGRVDLFTDPLKLTPGLGPHLGNGVAVRAPDGFGAGLEALKGMTVSVDPQTATAWVFDRLEAAGAKIVKLADPCVLAKACKNAVELAGSRMAHRRDGVAMTRFLAWFARHAPQGGLTEIAAADRLAAFRAEGSHFRDLSFRTISGAGPNGAIVHYSVTPESNRVIEPGSLYLVDSGAQYLDGTTDITRTLAVGRPSAAMREHFTRVLKGHIALAMARFPKGTTGSQLDSLARLALWQAGLDYDHGTGHGVGSYLGVHEGPQRFSKQPNSIALAPGMIISNEPGYYRTGEYGIRIENLLAVRPATELAGGERAMLGFETLTLAPIDLALVEKSLMTAAEIAWLDDYHTRVRTLIGPGLDPESALWLIGATRPIGG
jgi:Xaa-Pro aminopeptidase